ncbi:MULTISPECIES: hypothetical protein [unclassified Paraburkholderia]|jgi:hypothetical protein|uniref:hypothetical protein n=1 Tax=unclassified Paraburkholderia TaxID=2615204 RepID=UPI0009472F77|nr:MULTISPECIES: hypothetical protein [unclassified Paraburkholderia]APR36181.1 hypothetical protein BTO02_13020 [Paraburkholderia sp. SOS3]MDQ7977377.1 hypothetical protein [Paraburkholderia sp. SARCC-3016]
MGKYFLRNTEVAEPDAANAWFSYAGEHGIDMPKAISIWEDASSEEGGDSRRAVGKAGIRIEPGVG